MTEDVPEPVDEAVRRSNRRQLIGILAVVLIFGGGAVVELFQRLAQR